MSSLYNKFTDWYHEREAYGLRCERLTSDRGELEEAFNAGRSRVDELTGTNQPDQTDPFTVTVTKVRGEES